MCFSVQDLPVPRTFCVCIICKTKQQARLADARVTDEQKLEQVVAEGVG